MGVISPAWYFFFFASGFCGLVYEVVWLRLAMASFGVNAPLVSTVLSVFMAGLGLGSLAAGRLGKRLERPGAFSPLKAYALCELLIGLGGIAVPRLLPVGRALLERSSGAAWGTLSYYAASGLWLGLSLLPWCALMGATYPLAMAAIRRQKAGASDSFGRLYLANVGGAAAGTVLSAFVLIELLGFTRTALVAAAVNALIAAGALALDRKAEGAPAPAPAAAASASAPRSPAILLLLLATGLAGMAAEMVWIRLYIPYMGSTVYTFASILAVYLLATFAGSALYRAFGERGRGLLLGWPWIAAAVLGLLPLIGADPRLPLQRGLDFDLLRLALGIGPFCALLGFLTPMLVDRWSEGDPEAAGSAYAVNILGSLLGPLLAGFWLLPHFGERGALLGVMLALCAAGFLLSGRRWALATPAALLLIPAAQACKTYEDRLPQHLTLRDYEATVVAGGQGRGSVLMVNGIAMTMLTPVTKWMAHFPLAVLPRKPERALVICFGMGTTFRSMLSWGVRTDVVDLVPSVPAFFPYFHRDAEAILAQGRGRIHADDGRRWLERSPESYDVITIDPPPPIEAAASSLLYSEEFYRSAKRRLRPGGLLQQWLPGGGRPDVRSSVAQAFKRSFAYSRCFDFQASQGGGTFWLGSDSPFEVPKAKALDAKLPAEGRKDLLEWGDQPTSLSVYELITGAEKPLDAIIAEDAKAPPMRDDRPVNEYFIVKARYPRVWAGWQGLQEKLGL